MWYHWKEDKISYKLGTFFSKIKQKVHPELAPEDYWLQTLHSVTTSALTTVVIK
jgi:hypothetical protein